jgi:hypothetical protein
MSLAFRIILLFLQLLLLLFRTDNKGTVLTHRTLHVRRLGGSEVGVLRRCLHILHKPAPLSLLHFAVQNPGDASLYGVM